jgi:hypothetical protein
MFESADDLLTTVVEACAARDATHRAVALAVADAVATGAFNAAGLAHGGAWLRAYTESSPQEAGRLVALGRLLARHPGTRAAVESGALSPARAAVLAGAVTDARRGHFDEAEAVLLEQVAAVARVDDAEVVVGHWCRLVDQDLDPPAPGTEQRLYVQRCIDGSARLQGHLDAPTTAALEAGLDACDTGPDPLDAPLAPRTLAQRRADALGDLAGHALRNLSDDGEPGRDAGGDDGQPAARPRRTTNLMIDLPSLAGRTHTDLDGIVASLDGRPLSTAAVDQLLCGSWIAAVVTGADGAVLDATERSADFTDTQRRLIAVRDRHCAFPGCRLPASWCDVHHLTARAVGGGRALDNGVLLCRRHHTAVHRGWQLRPGPDGRGGWHATSPTGVTWTGCPDRSFRDPPLREPQLAPTG